MALLLCNGVVFHMHKNTSIRCVSFKHNKVNLLQLRIGLRMTEEGGGGIIVRMLTLIQRLPDLISGVVNVTVVFRDPSIGN